MHVQFSGWFLCPRTSRRRTTIHQSPSLRPRRSHWLRCLAYLRIGRMSVDDGDDYQVPSLDFSYLRTTEFTYIATFPKDTAINEVGGARRRCIHARPAACTCHKCKLSIFPFCVADLVLMVQSNVAVCVTEARRTSERVVAVKEMEAARLGGRILHTFVH